jgi:hypothetical protein
MIIDVAGDQATSIRACLRPFDNCDNLNKQLYINSTQAGNVGQPCTTNKLSTSHGFSMAFPISNRTNSFQDESATMMLRLDQQSKNS